VVRPQRIVAQAQCIIVQSGGIEIEDLYEGLSVHTLGSFQQRKFSSHCNDCQRNDGLKMKKPRMTSEKWIISFSN
jgi:hypothetical protein